MSETKIQEIWKKVNIEQFNNLYEVSNFGNIRRIDTAKVLKKELASGYHRVALAKPGLKGTSKHFLVHRLVALTFLENDDTTNKKIVNHKDGNKLNNNISNIEWSSYKENVNHAIKNKLRVKKGTPIIIIDVDGNVFEYASQKEAQLKAKLGENTILRALRQGTKPFGLTIRYKEDNYVQNIDLSDFEQLKNYPNYLINRSGDIYSKLVRRLISRYDSPGGYISVSLSKDNVVIPRFLHNIIAEQFIPNPNNLPIVNHIDHNKKNCSIENLEYCSYKENTQKYLKQKGSIQKKNSKDSSGVGEISTVLEKLELRDNPQPSS